MTARRTAEPHDREAAPVMTALNAPGPDRFSIVERLPLGVVVLRLEDPADVKTFRIVDLNPAAAEIAGSAAEDLRGRTLAEFPEFLKTALPRRCLAAFRSRTTRHLGEISDGGSRIRRGIYAVHAFPLPEDHLGVVIENIADRKLAQQPGGDRRADTLVRVNQRLRTRISERRHIEEQLKTSLEQLRELAACLQLVREEERARVARYIHDELGQACTAVKMDLALIGRKVTHRQVEIRAKVSSAIQVVDGLIVSLRRVASDLRPSTLDDLGLSAALEWLVQEFEKRTGVPSHLTLSQGLPALDSDQSTAIFRICQESLTNVTRHASATRVEASLVTEGDQLILQVRDNGKGFDAEAMNRRGSPGMVGKREQRAPLLAGELTRGALGLIGMRERAFLLSGELKIESRPGEGTTVTLRIPVLPSSLPSMKS